MRGGEREMLDPLIADFVHATDDAEADRRLSALIDDHALPLARAIASRKLRQYSAPHSSAEDVEDVVSESLLVLIDRLRTLRDASSAPIESFLDYTAVVVHNACSHYVRRRHPDRARLKNRLRYLVTNDARFAVWETATDDVCGLAAWRSSAPGGAAVEALRRMTETSDRRLALPRGIDADKKELAACVDRVLRAIGGAVELDRLVSAIAQSNGIDVRTASQTDPVNVAVAPQTGEAAIDRRRYTERLWSEIRDLPLRQRVALLLNLRDAGGAGMLWVFPMSGVASLREIALALEIAADELAALWKALPLDDAAIAQRLECTRQQVINLRMSARKRLANRLESGRPGKSPDRGNLRAVSHSWGTET
jgi:RNA polymerase sigma factor (sigma-70 family)